MDASCIRVDSPALSCRIDTAFFLLDSRSGTKVADPVIGNGGSMKLLMGVSILPLLFISFAIAAAEDEYSYTPFLHRVEIFANIGTGSWSFYQPDGGWLLGGGIVFRPYDKAGFEINVRHLRTVHEESYDRDSYFRNEETGEMVTGSVHYYFSQLRFQPYLLLGGGYAGSRRMSLYRTNEQEESYESNNSSFVIEAGGGVNLFLTKRFSVRPDVRMLIGSIGSIQGSANLCYHW